MVYIVDTHSWIEYFIGSEQGSELNKFLKKGDSKFITMECCLSEIKSFCLKNNLDFNKSLDTIRENSFILPVLREHWLNAAAIRLEMRKKIKNFGLIDAILVAKQQELKCKIISGDPHFKGMKNVVYIGA